MARLGIGIGLVGRRQEMSTLTAALERAESGRPTGILMSGDAGVGKSRLVAEVVERAAAAGFTVLVGRCLDAAESALPYLPFTEVVGALAATHPELVTEHAALRHLLPSGSPRAEQRGEDRDLGQLRVFDAVLSVLDQLTSATPVLLVIEDMHWADKSSRDLLVFLLSRLTAQRLVVLATYRTDDLHRRHPLRPVLSELVRLPAVERLELAPLGAAESLELVRSLADGTLSEPLLHRVAERSEGNAFFAEELVSASSDGLPHGLAEVLLARVEALSPSTQRVMRIAAVSGRRVRHDRLAAVSGLSDDDLEQALREAVAHHVLVAEPAVPAASASGSDAYTFRHALLREAIYNELLPGERSRLHGAYAKLLEERPDEPDVAAELAYHALAAHDLPRALAASVQAAKQVNEREAPAEVLLHSERALDLWDAVPDAESVAGVPEVRVTRWAAWGAAVTGDPDRAIALARRALQLAEERGDPHTTSKVGREYAIRLLELSGYEQEAHEVAVRALSLIADAGPTADLAWAHAILARTLFRIDRWAEAGEVAATALTVTSSLPDDDMDATSAEADALVSLAVSTERAGDPARARELWAEAIPLASRAGGLGVELRARYNSAISLLDEGRITEAIAAFAEGESRAAEAGITWSGYGLDLRVAHVIALFMAGEWDDSEAAAQLAGDSVSVTVASRLAAAGMLTVVARGRIAAARRRLAEIRATRPVDEQVIILLGQAGAEAALWDGKPAEAAQRIEEALDGLTAVAQHAPHQIGSIMLTALGVAAHAELAASGASSVADATKAAEALVAIADETAELGLPRAGSLGPEGKAWLSRGRAELTRITGPEPEAWSAVLEQFGFEGAAGQEGYRQAYARLRRAEALLAGGAAHGLVADDLRVALATADRLGALPLVGAVRAMAERAGVRLDSTAPRPSASDPLTPRERSVLALVAGGRTNRQVGNELFISEKTVSVHLSRVMAKLGAGSRTEAVSIAYAKGLLGPADQELAPADP